MKLQEGQIPENMIFATSAEKPVEGLDCPIYPLVNTALIDDVSVKRMPDKTPPELKLNLTTFVRRIHDGQECYLQILATRDLIKSWPFNDGSDYYWNLTTLSQAISIAICDFIKTVEVNIVSGEKALELYTWAK